MEAPQDGVELREITAVLKHGRRWIAGGTTLGLLAGALVILAVPSCYQATTSVLIRSETNSPRGMLSQIEGAMLAGLAGSIGQSQLETEVAILQSRAVIGAVVDSLGLQVEVLEPEETPTMSLFSRVVAEPRPGEGEYRFERSGDAYRVAGPAGETRWEPGAPLELPGAVLTPRGADLPEVFEVRLRSREAAIDRVEKALEVTSDQGDVVELQYRARDPETAAAVPNLMTSRYLARRKTTDRGVNQHRYEFLAAHVDTLAEELVRAERALRIHQERTGMLDPEVTGEAEVERAMEVRAALEETDVEVRALTDIVAQSGQGGLDARELAAYPSLIRNPAVTNVISQIMGLEAQRSALLGRRTPADPEVLTFDSTIVRLESQLLRLSSDYLEGLNRLRGELGQEMQAYREVLAILPAQAEQSFRLEREVERLSETLVVLQSQLVQARLDAISEGGEVRQVDPAVPPERPAFPDPLITLILGAIGGLVLGVGGAFGREYLGGRVEHPSQAQLAGGVPVVEVRPSTPLLLGGAASARLVLVVGVGRGARPADVARQLAATAMLQERDVGVADLSAASAPPEPRRIPASSAVDGVEVATADAYVEARPPGSFPVFHGGDGSEFERLGVRRAMGELEDRFSLVVAALPGLASPAAAALLEEGRVVVLVAQSRVVTRAELSEAVDVLARLGATAAGVVLHNGRSENDRRD